MSISSHLTELHTKHQQLESDIARALQQPSQDPLHVAALKKRKLRIKDEIERLARARS